jgi:catechol 1,2-dioxygenase
MVKLTRRGFLKGAAAGVAAVAAVRVVGRVAMADEPDEAATEDNIEGPFFRANAPFRTKLFDAGEAGDVMVVSGRVVSRNGRPLDGALLEVWQADAAGHYDNDDPDHQPAAGAFHLRGRMTTGRDGRYEFTTVKPKAYQIGPKQYRPPHIHVKVHHEGHRSLTTQLYFKGDKLNDVDPWYKPSLALDVRGGRAEFKFVLRKA